MSSTELRVRYKDGEPKDVKFGRGFFGEECSLAHMDDGTAVVAYDNAGSTDFPRELEKLPFVDDVQQ